MEHFKCAATSAYGTRALGPCRRAEDRIAEEGGEVGRQGRNVQVKDEVMGGILRREDDVLGRGAGGEAAEVTGGGWR